MANSTPTTITNDIDIVSAKLNAQMKFYTEEDNTLVNDIISKLRASKADYGYFAHAQIDFKVADIKNKQLRSLVDLELQNIKRHLPLYNYIEGGAKFFGVMGMILGMAIGTATFLALLPFLPQLLAIAFCVSFFIGAASLDDRVFVVMGAPLLLLPALGAAIVGLIGAGIGLVLGAIAGKIAQLDTKSGPTHQGEDHDAQPPRVGEDALSTTAICDRLTIVDYQNLSSTSTNSAAENLTVHTGKVTQISGQNASAKTLDQVELWHQLRARP